MIGLNILEARGLGKRYGEQWALRDCSLALPAGRVVGLVGPNGAGKTTLLQLAVGMLAPSAGEIAVFGRDPREAKRPSSSCSTSRSPASTRWRGANS